MKCHNTRCDKDASKGNTERVGLVWSKTRTLWYCSMNCVVTSQEYRRCFSDRKSSHWDEKSRVLEMNGKRVV